MVRRYDPSKVPELRGSRFPPSLSKPVLFAALLFFVLINPILLRAASNPVPYISAISPTAVAPGGPDFTLTVRGTGLINGQSTVFWNGAALPDPITCTAANPPQLAACTVAVRAAMVAAAATASITVVSAGPGGGVSNVVFLPTTNPTSNVTMGYSTVPAFPLYAQTAVTGDFNGDGKLDIAAPDYCGNNPNCSSGPGIVRILLGNGDGTFTATATPPATEVRPELVATGDFNDDGKIDLIVYGYCAIGLPCSGPTISVLLGDGTGNFTAGAAFAAALNGVSSFLVGDFNNDGKLDFATSSNHDSSLSVYLGNGDGTFTASALIATGLTTISSAVTGDFNGDSNLDFAVQGCLRGVTGCSGSTVVLFGDGAGNFAQGPTTLDPSPPGTDPGAASLASGDFTGDGLLDLAVLDSTNHTITVLQGSGDGTFNALSVMVVPDSTFENAISADFNGDGKLDLAVPCFTSGGGGPDFAHILLGDGAGNFTDNSIPATNASLAMALGDFNNDGRLDLLAPLYYLTPAVVFLQAADLTLSKSHSGNFSQGQSGAAYTINVTNSGSADTNALVTITDTIPTGLTATAISGSGWNCSANTFPIVGDGTATASCTRTDVLGPAASYPHITLTVNVAVDAPASLTNTANVSGGGDADTSNNTAQDPTTITTYNVSLLPFFPFPSQVVGTSSLPHPLILTVKGTGTLEITSIAVSGDFTQTNNCGSVVGPGGSCIFIITFAPTATGLRTGTLTISDNAPDSPQIISLSGTGTQPAVTLSATSLHFDGQLVGNVGLPQNFTLSNSGTSPLHISSVVASSNFGDYNGCVSPLPAGSTCTIGVAFDPATSGTISGTLTITDDAPGSPHTVALSGTGKDFSLAPTGSTGPTANIAQGLTASYILSLAPSGGFNQPVAFTCTGAPLKSSCNVNPAVVTLNSTSPTKVMVTVATTVSTMGLPMGTIQPPAMGAPPIFIWPATFIFAGLMLGWARRKRGRVPLRLALGTGVLLVAMLGAFSMPGCGGTSVQAPVVYNEGTPSGTYILNVTGTFTTGSTTLTHSVQLTLTVH